MPPPKPTRAVLKIITGRLITGNVARLTLYGDGRCLYERQDYVSPHADGWRVMYPPMEGDLKEFYWLENQLRNTPAKWLE